MSTRAEKVYRLSGCRYESTIVTVNCTGRLQHQQCDSRRACQHAHHAHWQHQAACGKGACKLRKLIQVNALSMQCRAAPALHSMLLTTSYWLLIARVVPVWCGFGTCNQPDLHHTREWSCSSTARARHALCSALRLSQKAAAIMTARKPYKSRSGRDVNSATLAILERKVSARHAGTWMQLAASSKAHLQACTLAQQGLQRAHQLRRSPCIPLHNPFSAYRQVDKQQYDAGVCGEAMLGSGAHSSTAPPNSQTPATMIAWNICAGRAATLSVTSSAARVKEPSKTQGPDIYAGTDAVEQPQHLRFKQAAMQGRGAR